MDLFDSTGKGAVNIRSALKSGMRGRPSESKNRPKPCPEASRIRIVVLLNCIELFVFHDKLWKTISS